jgi:hypothetical protein
MSSLLSDFEHSNFTSESKLDAISILSSQLSFPFWVRFPIWFLSLDCDPQGLDIDRLCNDYSFQTTDFPQLEANSETPPQVPGLDSPIVSAQIGSSFKTVRVDLPRGVDFFNRLMRDFNDKIQPIDPIEFQWRALRIFFVIAKVSGTLDYLQGQDRFLMMSLIVARLFIIEKCGKDDFEKAEAIAFPLTRKLIEKANLADRTATAPDYFRETDESARKGISITLMKAVEDDGSFSFAFRWALVWFADDYNSGREIALIWDQLIWREGVEFKRFMKCLLLAHMEVFHFQNQSGFSAVAEIQHKRDWNPENVIQKANELMETDKEIENRQNSESGKGGRFELKKGKWTFIITIIILIVMLRLLS